jgi:hypothetical protein
MKKGLKREQLDPRAKLLNKCYLNEPYRSSSKEEGLFLLSTYEIWKVLVSFAKNIFLDANFHVLGLFIPKGQVYSEKNISVCHATLPALPEDFWTKFEAQLAIHVKC